LIEAPFFLTRRAIERDSVLMQRAEEERAVDGERRDFIGGFDPGSFWPFIRRCENATLHPGCGYRPCRSHERYVASGGLRLALCALVEGELRNRFIHRKPRLAEPF
jgi:hypothetical protein